jgi:RES domain-containing protein
VLPESELCKALLDVPTLPEVGIWSRVVGYHLLQGPPPGSVGPPQPLWPGGSARGGARFTAKGSFGSIYLASDPVTALKEVAALLTGIETFRTPPWVVFTVEGFLERVLDLTDPTVQRRLGTSLAELTGDWRYSQDVHERGDGPLPSTQLLGKVAHETGEIVAMRFHSAKNIGEGVGWVVFEDRLVAGKASFLEVCDPHGLIQQRLP